MEMQLKASLFRCQSLKFIMLFLSQFYWELSSIIGYIHSQVLFGFNLLFFTQLS
jgi:hypothetical protein